MHNIENNAMFYEMTPQSSQAIFQWSRSTPELGKPVLRRKDWTNPLIELACEIQDLAIVRDEDGEETWEDEQAIPIGTVLPYAIVLADAIKDYPDQTIATLHSQLVGWINGGRRQGRAYNIKSLVFQICGRLTDPRPSKPVVNDDLPF